MVCGGGGGGSVSIRVGGWVGGCVHVRVWVYSVFVILLSCIVCLCMCPCMGQANNQEKGEMKTRQQEKKMINVPTNVFKPTPTCL